MKPGEKPFHINDDVWSLTKRMSVRQCVGQLVEFNPVTARTRTGRDLADLVSTGDVGLVKYVPPPDLRRLQDLARSNGQIPLLCVSDYQRGVTVVGPSGFGAPHSWNPSLVEEAARVAADHMRIAGVSMTFSPVADHAYGLRQGRSQEGGGVESPLLMSRMVAAMVRGFQSAGEIAATVKHIGPYQYTDGPDYTTLPLSERAFLEDCWPAYEAGLEAGTKAVMMSFADLDGVPSHASPYLVRLVKQHAIPGVVFISDFTGINELVEFGVAGNQREAVFLAFTKGNIHVDLNGGVYHQHLGDLVESGAIPEHDLRVRAAEVIQLKKGLGLLDDPCRHLGGERQEVLTAEVPAYVELARQSIVLLRPKSPKPGLLPIPRKAKILVTGPLAHSQVDWLGDYSGDAKAYLDMVVTPLQGVRAIWPTAQFAAGTDFEDALPDLESALLAAEDRTHIIACLGEKESWSGEAKTRLTPKVPDAQARFVEALRKAAPKAKIIALVTAGRALHIPEALEKCADAVLWVPQLGTYAGLAIADVLSGKADPSGRLACSLPCHDRLTSGFSYRERRNGRPAFSTNPDYQFREPGWNASYLELGERRELAEFTFGEGYGYTTFEYSKRRLSGKEMSVRRSTRLKASVIVTNTSNRAGKETVQLYWHDTVSVCAPRRLELLDFRQIELAGGESRKVTFEIAPGALAQYGKDLGEGPLPRPDAHPVYLIAARNAGEADRMLRERQGLLAFTLVA